MDFTNEQQGDTDCGRIAFATAANLNARNELYKLYQVRGTLNLSNAVKSLIPWGEFAQPASLVSERAPLDNSTRKQRMFYRTEVLSCWAKCWKYQEPESALLWRAVCALAGTKWGDVSSEARLLAALQQATEPLPNPSGSQKPSDSSPQPSLENYAQCLRSGTAELVIRNDDAKVLGLLFLSSMEREPKNVLERLLLAAGPLQQQADSLFGKDFSLVVGCGSFGVS